jgi:hypothetical protein
MLLALVVSVVAEGARPDTWPEVMAIGAAAAVVICPWALIPRVKAEDVEPYDPAVTPVLEMLNVVDGLRFRPVPALYVTEALN